MAPGLGHRTAAHLPRVLALGGLLRGRGVCLGGEGLLPRVGGEHGPGGPRGLPCPEPGPVRRDPADPRQGAVLRRAEPPPVLRGARLSGDDVATLAERIPFRCAHKQRSLGALVARRRSGRRPSNRDTIPVSPPLFRTIREGLGLTHATSGRPSSVNSIENGYTEPTRPVA